jgi:cytosine/adenosine deaminase-related metal-dependent hydrolase
MMPDVEDLDAYVELCHHTLAPIYRAEDVYLGNFLAAMGCIDAGITTITDFFHNRRSREHAEAAVHGLRDSGIRAVLACCAPLSGDWDGLWPGDLARLRDYAAQSGLVSVRMGVLGSADAGPDRVVLSADKVRFARENGFQISIDAVLGPRSASNIISLGRDHLLSSDMTFIHCNDLSSGAWDLLSESMAHVSLAVTSDAHIGIADSIPPIQQCLDAGISPSLGVDVEIALTTDMFTQMRVLLATQRMHAFSRRYRGDTSAPPGITTREVLEMATLGGARANGLEQTCGTLAPGKRADILMITADEVNNLPLNNPFGTVVLGADARNIEAVFVDGVARKWRGSIVSLDLDELSERVRVSRDYLLRSAGLADEEEQCLAKVVQARETPVPDVDVRQLLEMQRRGSRCAARECDRLTGVLLPIGKPLNTINVLRVTARTQINLLNRRLNLGGWSS